MMAAGGPSTRLRAHPGRLRQEGTMRVRAVGADALLLEVDDPAAWFAELWRRRDAGELAATEIVPGARTVLLDGLADPAATGEAVRHWTLADSRQDTGAAERTVEIAVTFDGPDLPFVAV